MDEWPRALYDLQWENESYLPLSCLIPPPVIHGVLLQLTAIDNTFCLKIDGQVDGATSKSMFAQSANSGGSD